MSFLGYASYLAANFNRFTTHTELVHSKNLIRQVRARNSSPLFFGTNKDVPVNLLKLVDGPAENG